MRVGRPHDKKNCTGSSSFLRNRRLFKLFETTLTGCFHRRRIPSVRLRRWFNARCALGFSQRSGTCVMQQIASIMVYWLEHLIVDGTRSQESFRADNRLLSHQPQERDVVVRSTLNGQAPPPSCSDLLQVGPHVVSLRAPFRKALISSRGRGSRHAPCEQAPRAHRGKSSSPESTHKAWDRSA